MYESFTWSMLGHAAMHQGLPADRLQEFYITLNTHLRIRKMEKKVEELNAICQSVADALNRKHGQQRAVTRMKKFIERNNRACYLLAELTALACLCVSAIEREYTIEANKKLKR